MIRPAAVGCQFLTVTPRPRRAIRGLFSPATRAWPFAMPQHVFKIRKREAILGWLERSGGGSSTYRYRSGGSMRERWPQPTLGANCGADCCHTDDERAWEGRGNRRGCLRALRPGDSATARLRDGVLVPACGRCQQLRPRRGMARPVAERRLAVGSPATAWQPARPTGPGAPCLAGREPRAHRRADRGDGLYDGRRAGYRLRADSYGDRRCGALGLARLVGVAGTGTVPRLSGCRPAVVLGDRPLLAADRGSG